MGDAHQTALHLLARRATSRRLIRSFMLLLAFGGYATSGLAGNDESLDLLAQENQVFAASRYIQAIQQSPANASVLTRDDIRRFGYRSIHEALASLPGIYNAASQWPALGVRGTAVPGDFGSRILYLVNGMPMYEATYGGFFIEYLDIESIERIEFIKGAGSALYGSGAVQAVVNLITRSGYSSSGKTISAEAASQRHGKLYGSWGEHDRNGIDRFISVSATDSAGRDIYLRELDTPAFNSGRYGGISTGRDSMRNIRLFGRMASKMAWMQGLLISADKDDPLASYNTVFNGRLRIREALGALEAGITRELPNGAHVTARTYYFNAAEKGDYPYSRIAGPFGPDRGAPTDFINVSDLSSNQLGMELQFDKFLSNGHHVLAGAEVKHIASRQRVGDQPGPVRSGVVTVNSSHHYSQWSIFAQDELRVGSGRWFLGARYDYYDGFSEGVSSRLSPRIAYLHEFSADTSSKLIYSEAYRVPTLYESHYQDGIPQAETIWANPALRPELSRSLEAVLEHQQNARTKWKLAAFINRLHDTPVQVVTPSLNGVPCLLGPNSCIQYRNSGGTQQIYGVEANVDLKFSRQGHLYASAVLQRSAMNGQRVASSPRYQMKTGLSHPLPWQNMSGALEAHYTDGMLGRLDAQGSRSASVPGYLLINGNITAAHLPGGWRASLRLTNLLNRTFYTVASRELQPVERVPAPGRRISLQMQLDF